MDLALQYTTSSTTLKILNSCQIYLQVILLSNITTTDGQHVLPEIVQGHTPTTSQPITLFPYQTTQFCAMVIVVKIPLTDDL